MEAEELRAAIALETGIPITPHAIRAAIKDQMVSNYNDVGRVSGHRFQRALATACQV